MSPSFPNPVSASSKLSKSRSRSSTALGSSRREEAAASPRAAGGGSAATATAAAVEGRLGLPGGFATAGLVAPEAAVFAAAGPPPQDPAAVRSLPSFYFSAERREGRSSCAVERRRKRGRGRREEIRPVWHRARLDLAAAAAVPASASECSLPLSGRSFSCRRGGSSRPSSSSSSAVLDCSCACCKQRRRRLSSSFAERGACYGVLGEPQ